MFNWTTVNVKVSGRGNRQSFWVEREREREREREERERLLASMHNLYHNYDLHLINHFWNVHYKWNITHYQDWNENSYYIYGDRDIAYTLLMIR